MPERVLLLLLLLFPIRLPCVCLCVLICAACLCCCHQQGVPLARRFALVPLGPPLLSYSSTAKVRRAICAALAGTSHISPAGTWCNS